MLTVVVPTFNNADSIERVLRSALAVADRLVVADSFSTDDTTKIAASMGAQVFQREYGYSASQKNWILGKVETEWVLILDSDEVLSEELVVEIQTAFDKGIPDDVIAYRIPFVHYLWGKAITGRCDHKVKLFRSRLFRFEDKLVHAHPVTDAPGLVLTMTHPVRHFGIKSMEHWFQKMNRYTSWDVQERQKRRRFRKWELVVKPPVVMLKVLLSDGMLFRGVEGYAWALMQTASYIELLLKHCELAREPKAHFMEGPI
jgi:glycosyltransferase involved in cell wall biosynthesis